MSELIISNTNKIARIEPFIIDKFNTYGAAILDPGHPGFTNEEKFEIMRMKYWNEFIADALETGHFVETLNGKKLTVPGT